MVVLLPRSVREKSFGSHRLLFFSHFAVEVCCPFIVKGDRPLTRPHVVGQKGEDTASLLLQVSSKFDPTE